MIDLSDIKYKIHNSDKYRGTELDGILQDTDDVITEAQYLTLVPIILKLSRQKGVTVLA